MSERISYQDVTPPSQVEVIEGLFVNYSPESTARDGSVFPETVLVTAWIDEHTTIEFDVPYERWHELSTALLQARAYSKPFVMPTTPAEPQP